MVKAKAYIDKFDSRLIWAKLSRGITADEAKVGIMPDLYLIRVR